MQKKLTQFGLIGLVGIGFTLAISSCEFDRREVSLVEGLAFNLPIGDAGGAEASNNGSGLVEPAQGVASSQLGLSPESLDFGAAVVGFEAYRRVTVTNGGSAPLTQLALALVPETDASLAIAQNLCGTELAPGLSCDVRLRFFPTVTGPVSGVFNVSSAEQRASIPLTATGAEQGDLVLLPSEGSSADFGATLLGSTVEASYRVDNPLDVESGIITFYLANPAFALQPPAPGECQSGVTSLLGGESCNVRVAFIPAERGPNEATLTTTSANLGSTSLSLRGQGWLRARSRWIGARMISPASSLAAQASSRSAWLTGATCRSRLATSRSLQAPMRRSRSRRATAAPARCSEAKQGWRSVASSSSFGPQI